MVLHVKLLIFDTHLTNNNVLKISISHIRLKFFILRVYSKSVIYTQYSEIYEKCNEAAERNVAKFTSVAI